MTKLGELMLVTELRARCGDRGGDKRQGDLVHFKPESSPFQGILQSLVNHESWSAWGKGRVLRTLWGRGDERETVPDYNIYTDIADSAWQAPLITMALWEPRNILQY